MGTSKIIKINVKPVIWLLDVRDLVERLYYQHRLLPMEIAQMLKLREKSVRKFLEMRWRGA